MKQIYIITLICLLNLNFLNGQIATIDKRIGANTVTIDNPTIGAEATYIFTYTISNAIGTGTFVPIIFEFVTPIGYRPISTSITGASNLDPYITFKVNGTSYLCSSTFGLGGSWSNGIILSVEEASSGITISAGSTIEITITGLITNPSSLSTYTLNWQATDSFYAPSDDYSYDINFTTLSTQDINTKNNSIKIHPNPASDYIQLNGLTTKENYKIYNILGVNVKKGTIDSQEQIDIRNINNGLYLLKFDNGNTLKFIKR